MQWFTVVMDEFLAMSTRMNSQSVYEYSNETNRLPYFDKRRRWREFMFCVNTL